MDWWSVWSKQHEESIDKQSFLQEEAKSVSRCGQLVSLDRSDIDRLDVQRIIRMHDASSCRHSLTIVRLLDGRWHSRVVYMRITNTILLIIINDWLMKPEIWNISIKQLTSNENRRRLTFWNPCPERSLLLWGTVWNYFLRQELG